MKYINHIGIYTPGNTDKKFLINQLESGKIIPEITKLAGLNGFIYSAVALQHFIDDELRHDEVKIDTGLNNQLSVASSGEQRRALLNYILSQHPSYIIIDEVYESLDVVASEAMLQKMKSIADSILLIQIFSRKRDLLPFIQELYYLDAKGFPASVIKEDFLAGVIDTSEETKAAIPPPLLTYLPPPDPLIKMTDVNVQYSDRPILKNINWQIKSGEFWQLTGPNGSGKSTLLAMITGDNPKAYGQDIVLFGKQKGTGETVWEIKEKIGYLSPNMLRDFERQDSIGQMITSGFYDSVGLYLKPTDMQVQRANEWLRLIGMSGEKNKPFRLFPPGQQRMILIARAMVKHPPLLILDEPSSGLDDEEAILFSKLVNQLATETSTAIIYVSHRKEPGLTPSLIYELTPSPGGSTGKTIT